MQQNNISPYFILLSIINIVNILFSVHFIPLLLAGIVLELFLDTLIHKQYYLFGYSILSFLIIENTQGMPLFILTIVAIVLYYIVIPRIKHLFSITITVQFVILFYFYLTIYIIEQFGCAFDLYLVKIFSLNFLLDSLIVGLFL